MPHHDPQISTNFPVVDLDELPDDLRERIEEVQQKSGFLPNVFRGIARRPEEIRAFLDFHDSIMDRESETLTKADRELIVVATSAHNNCLYCVVAHGAIARIRTKNPTIADQVAIDYRKADLDDRQRAILDVAMKLATRPAEVSETDHQRLRDAGLSEDDVYDVGAIAAFFAMSNRLAHWNGLRPNEEFYLMGRQPR
ncbi:peroxidase-related enzyme [Epidermidibacterium keratini]|uniref:Peroxidase-related enzyme n=1 Tax=Epidermidibacterium keratini TaxID=1891644 RepID=A0A7L4YJ79_9ACTN|nr:peroxidase-related enzyme [Epidermidibacterium keratini]QHB99137.1 peroxidase-related enzyme [Epidermidibacterium keratini]